LFTDSTEDDAALPPDAEQTEDTIEYKVNIPQHPFNILEKYSIMFEEVCDTYNISREGSRAIRHLVNLMLSDENLGKDTIQIKHI
jgi:hypothetical protein